MEWKHLWLELEILELVLEEILVEEALLVFLGILARRFVKFFLNRRPRIFYFIIL